MAEFTINIDSGRLRELIDQHIAEVIAERDALAAARDRVLNVCDLMEKPNVDLPWIPVGRVRELLAATELAAPPNDDDDEGAYRYLADAVIERFNPADGEEAEEWICNKAIHDAADFIERQACECSKHVVCRRCHALGQYEREPVQR